MQAAMHASGDACRGRGRCQQERQFHVLLGDPYISARIRFPSAPVKHRQPRGSFATPLATGIPGITGLAATTTALLGTFGLPPSLSAAAAAGRSHETSPLSA